MFSCARYGKTFGTLNKSAIYKTAPQALRRHGLGLFKSRDEFLQPMNVLIHMRLAFTDIVVTPIWNPPRFTPELTWCSIVHGDSMSIIHFFI